MAGWARRLGSVAATALALGCGSTAGGIEPTAPPTGEHGPEAEAELGPDGRFDAPCASWEIAEDGSYRAVEPAAAGEAWSPGRAPAIPTPEALVARGAREEAGVLVVADTSGVESRWLFDESGVARWALERTAQGVVLEYRFEHDCEGAVVELAGGALAPCRARGTAAGGLVRIECTFDRNPFGPSTHDDGTIELLCDEEVARVDLLPAEGAEVFRGCEPGVMDGCYLGHVLLADGVPVWAMLEGDDLGCQTLRVETGDGGARILVDGGGVDGGFSAEYVWRDGGMRTLGFEFEASEI